MLWSVASVSVFQKVKHCTNDECIKPNPAEPEPKRLNHIGQADKCPSGKLPYARSEKKGVYTKKL